MKKIFTIILVLFLGISVYGQDLDTWIKLHEVSATLGIVNELSKTDSAAIKARIAKKKKREEESLRFLLRAAEYYKTSDFESALFYVNKVVNFEWIDYNNLKYVVKVGSYANQKDIENTFYAYKDAKKYVDPENMRIIRKEIVKNIDKNDLRKAIQRYYSDSTINRLIRELKYE